MPAITGISTACIKEEIEVVDSDVVVSATVVMDLPDIFGRFFEHFSIYLMRRLVGEKPPENAESINKNAKVNETVSFHKFFKKAAKDKKLLDIIDRIICQNLSFVKVEVIRRDTKEHLDMETYSFQHTQIFASSKKQRPNTDAAKDESFELKTKFKSYQ